VFAPAAGDLHRVGVDAFVDVERVSPTDSFEDLRLPEATPTAEGAAGEVLTVSTADIESGATVYLIYQSADRNATATLAFREAP